MKLSFTTIGNKEEEELVHKTFGASPRYIRCEGTLMPETFRKFSDDILNFQVRDDDIWVCSFPKCGTTWTQEMVWCIANNIDLEGAKVNLQERFPFFEICVMKDFESLHSLNPKIVFPESITDSIRYVKNLPSPRFIKCHLPFHLLPLQLQQCTTKAKVVYVSRNVKDTCVSYYYHSKVMNGNTGSLEEFAQLFISDAVTWAPFWKHTLGFWKRRHQDNFLFLKYEDMKQDLQSVVKKTADFLGKSLTETQMTTLCHHLSFEEMKNNKAVNYEMLAELVKAIFKEATGQFMRNGKVGDWKTKLSPEWVQRFDKWTEENLKDSDFSV